MFHSGAESLTRNSSVWGVADRHIEADSRLEELVSSTEGAAAAVEAEVRSPSLDLPEWLKKYDVVPHVCYQSRTYRMEIPGVETAA